MLVYLVVIWAEASNVGDAANMDMEDAVDLIDVAKVFSDEEGVDVADTVSVAVDIVDVDATNADADTYVADTVSLDSAFFIWCTLLL